MFDLGRTLLAAVERSSDATAITDGEQRLGYAAWYEEIAHLAGGFTALGLRRGDRLPVILQNRLEMASLHWACQLAGIVLRGARNGVASGQGRDRGLRLPGLSLLMGADEEGTLRMPESAEPRRGARAENGRSASAEGTAV